MSVSSKNDFCFICSVGVPDESKRHSSFERNSSTFNLLSELLRIKTSESEGNGGVVDNFDGIHSDSKFTPIIFLCASCSVIVQDLTKLQELLENTKKSIRKKVRWIRSTFHDGRRSKTVEVEAPDTISKL